MATTYKLHQFNQDESEVRAAIGTLTTCGTAATVESIQEFTELPKTRVQNALRTLKAQNLVIVQRAK